MNNLKQQIDPIHNNGLESLKSLTEHFNQSLSNFIIFVNSVDLKHNTHLNKVIFRNLRDLHCHINLLLDSYEIKPKLNELPETYELFPDD